MFITGSPACGTLLYYYSPSEDMVQLVINEDSPHPFSCK